MLSQHFFIERDVVMVAQMLLGMKLCCSIGGRLKVGMITETEAYHQNEKACHAYNGRRTKRTEPLFNEGGTMYIYLCYGIHHLFNITTGPKDEAAAVLIRAIQPLQGTSDMLKNRNLTKPQARLTSGPGKLTQAMGISVNYSGRKLSRQTGIWIDDGETRLMPSDIVSTARVGVDYAEEHARLPWRFYLKDSSWVSIK